MSQLLYPEQAEIGLAQAIRAMLRRLPTSIQVDTDLDPSVSRYDDPAFDRVALSTRLLVLRVLEEAISNALRHGHAAALRVSVAVVDDGVLALVVDDDGTGVPEAASFSGLATLRTRVELHSGTLALGNGPLGGARLSLELPLAVAMEGG